MLEDSVKHLSSQWDNHSACAMCQGRLFLCAAMTTAEADFVGLFSVNLKM